MRAVIGLATLLLATAAQAGDMGFKAMPFGISLDAARKAERLFCRPDGTKLADTRCMFEEPAKRTFGGHYSHELWLNFIGGRFDSFTGEFRVAGFDAIRDALQQRYGPGQCISAYPQACVWNLPEGEAVVMVRRGMVWLTVGSAAGKAERLRRQAQATAKARGDA